MRLILLDRPTAARTNFAPLALSRPIFELRLGMTTLAEKLLARFRADQAARFVPDYLADVYRNQSGQVVNDTRSLRGDDLLLVDGRVKADVCDFSPGGPSRVALDAHGDVLAAWIQRDDLAKLSADSLESLLASAKTALPLAAESVGAWQYIWELILANPGQLIADFQAAGRHGVEGRVAEPKTLLGSRQDIYIAPGCTVYPMVTIDAEHGPVYLDEGATVRPFTLIEGPCYVGRNSMLLGAKCRRGNSIGPTCRLGGEIEESIFQGWSNMYHDGFMGHAYVGQWVNLGALTTNSDLKNDYSSVSVILDGQTPIPTGSTKIGSLIGDHAKTSIGSLLNTGAYLGAMSAVVTDGRLAPKFLPSFTWYLHGEITVRQGKESAYRTAQAAMSRRGQPWTEADGQMWDAIYDLTAPGRDRNLGRGRRAKGE